MDYISNFYIYYLWNLIVLISVIKIFYKCILHVRSGLLISFLLDLQNVLHVQKKLNINYLRSYEYFGGIRKSDKCVKMARL